MGSGTSGTLALAVALFQDLGPLDVAVIVVVTIGAIVFVVWALKNETTMK